MPGLLRILIITTIVYIAYRIIRRVLSINIYHHRSNPSQYDRAKEVKNAGFTEDEVQDARYKDIK